MKKIAIIMAALMISQLLAACGDSPVTQVTDNTESYNEVTTEAPPAYRLPEREDNKGRKF